MTKDIWTPQPRQRTLPITDGEKLTTALLHALLALHFNGSVIIGRLNSEAGNWRCCHINIMTSSALCSRIRASTRRRPSNSNFQALSRIPVPRALAPTGALLDPFSVKSHGLHRMCHTHVQSTADVKTVDPCAAHQAAGKVNRRLPGALSLAAAALIALNGAVAMPAVAGSLIAGEYSDPSHPGCQRSIDDDGVVHGADAELPLKPGAACLPGTEAVAWEVSGEISEDEMSIFVNFGEFPRTAFPTAFQDSPLKLNSSTIIPSLFAHCCTTEGHPSHSLDRIHVILGCCYCCTLFLRNESLT